MKQVLINKVQQGLWMKKLFKSAFFVLFFILTMVVKGFGKRENSLWDRGRVGTDLELET